MKDRHAAQTCLIIGNGVSLRDVPLEFLRKYPSFGTNRIFLLKGFTPTYYVAINPLVVSQNIEQIKRINSVNKFIRKDQSRKIPGAIPLTSVYFLTFSKSPDKYVYEGYTVTYVCMQLAYWMGFTKALLVGIDHRYSFIGKPNKKVIANSEDVNHFDKTYFSDGMQWNNPDLENSEESYRLARGVFEKAGRSIINLTEGTALDVFEKGSINDF